MKNSAFIALGSNIGSRFDHLKEAIEMIDQLPDTRVVNTSSIYETDPVGYEDQEQFLNMAIQISTGLSPCELLDACLDIELKLGRKGNPLGAPDNRP